MALVHFLDGVYAGRAIPFDDDLIVGEGVFRLNDSGIVPDARAGEKYYLKRMSAERWTSRDTAEWTAALDDDAAGDL